MVLILIFSSLTSAIINSLIGWYFQLFLVYIDIPYKKKKKTSFNWIIKISLPRITELNLACIEKNYQTPGCKMISREKSRLIWIMKVHTGEYKRNACAILLFEERWCLIHTTLLRCCSLLLDIFDVTLEGEPYGVFILPRSVHAFVYILMAVA